MEIHGPNRNINPVGPETGPAGPSGPEKTGGASFSETLGAGAANAAGATGGAAAAGGATPISTDPLLARIQSRIQEGIKAGEPKQKILESLIGEQLKTQFNGQASPQMTAAVTDRFQTDPNLSQLFNQLYAMATK